MVEKMRKSKEEVLIAMADYDPYLHGPMVLVDTDYDDFLISYHCRDTVNEEGDAHFLAVSVFVRDP